MYVARFILFSLELCFLKKGKICTFRGVQAFWPLVQKKGEICTFFWFDHFWPLVQKKCKILKLKRAKLALFSGLTIFGLWRKIWSFLGV
jgi:hypothetical protein